MKIEIGSSLPKHFVEYRPGQYEVFSHFEYACGIPHVLFAVTTLKENGKPNINFHAWSCFQGDEGGFFVVMAGIYQHTHTYANIMRAGEFCVNFLSVQHYDALIKTIQHNDLETDEFEAGGFTSEPSRTIAVPRISDSFLTLECTRHSIVDISGAGRTALIIGKVQQIAAEPDYAKGIDNKYSPDGFMFNIHSPKNLTTGGDDVSAVATLHLEKTY